jgi:hypothetical protein
MQLILNSSPQIKEDIQEDKESLFPFWLAQAWQLAAEVFMPKHTTTLQKLEVTLLVKSHSLLFPVF